MAILLSVLLLLTALCGCGGGADDTKDSYKVAIVLPMEHTSLNQIKQGIIAELKASDIGDKIEIIERNANGDGSMLPTIMSELCGSEVDMIIPIATGTAQAAQAATTEIPIVFSAASTPVESGLVSDMTVTDKNITGVSDAISVEAIFELAAQLTPNAKTFGLIYNSGESNSIAGMKRVKSYCDANSLSYKEGTVTSTADIQQVVSSLIGEVDAFLTLDDNTVASAMKTYSQLAIEAKLPAYVGADSMVKDGGLATVGINYDTLSSQTGKMAVRILKGEAISANPVETVSDFAKIINKTTADAIGVSISDEMAAQFQIVE